MTQLSLLNESELEALIAELDVAPAVPVARDLATEIREFHGWTVDKLHVFEKYLKLYRRVAGSGAFIDGFAGTGRGLLVRNGQETTCDGSALIAAKSGAFASLDLIELDKHNHMSLQNSLESLTIKERGRVRTYEADCNEAIPKILASGCIDPDRPCFALLDQESTQLEWSTIETLAKWKTYIPPEGRGRPRSCKVELWILFNSHQVIKRLWPNDHERYPDSLSPQTLDRIMGGRDAWRDLWEAQRPVGDLVRRYAERLRELGYVYAIPQVIRDPVSQRAQYHMIHVTDHPSAITLMRWAKRASSGYESQALPGMS